MGRFVVQCEYTCRNGVALWLAPFFFLWGSSISALAGHAGNKKAPHGFIEHAGRGEPNSNDRFSLLAMMQCQRQPETRAVGLPDAASRNRMELDGTSGESPSTNLQVVRQLSNHYGDFTRWQVLCQTVWIWGIGFSFHCQSSLKDRFRTVSVSSLR